MPTGTPVPAHLRAVAVQAYRDGESAPSISSRLGYSTTILYKWIAAAGVPRVTGRGMRRWQQPLLPDDVLTPAWLGTEAGAWALGMHVTDGTLQPGRPRQEHWQVSMKLRLALKDRDGVERFAEAFGLPGRVCGTSGMHVFNISHERLAFLVQIGQPVGVKSGAAALPGELVTDRHALRGVIDGDGYASMVGRPASKKRQLHLGLRTSSPVLREQAAGAFCSLLGMEGTVCVHARGVTATNSAAATLIRILYEDTTFTIARKREKALRLADEFERSRARLS